MRPQSGKWPGSGPKWVPTGSNSKVNRIRLCSISPDEMLARGSITTDGFFRASLAIAAPSTTRDIQSIRKLIEVERARKAVQEDGPDFTAALARVEEVNDDRQGQTNSSADHLSSDGKPSADIPLHCDRSISEFLRSQARFNVSHPGARV